MIDTPKITTRQNIRARRQRIASSSEANVSLPERWVSALAGAALASLGLSRRSVGGTLLALGGITLLYRGVTGRCMVYQTLGINTANKGRSVLASVGHGQGIKVEKSVTVNRSPEELYRFWHNFENLPRFMEHLESVRQIDDTRSHWVAKAPAGTTVEWEAEIYNEKENELIAWRSLENSDINHAGSVHFRPAPNGRGTEVTVQLNYEPPAGKLGATIAKLFGEEPERQLEEDLPRFKQLVEAGEIPTTLGQPSAHV